MQLARLERIRSAQNSLFCQARIAVQMAIDSNLLLYTCQDQRSSVAEQNVTDAFVDFLEEVFEIFLTPLPIGVGSEQHSLHLSNRRSAGGPTVEDMVRFPCIHPSPQPLWRQSLQFQLLPALVGIHH